MYEKASRQPFEHSSEHGPHRDREVSSVRYIFNP